jgi:hypothetical protein
VGSLGFAGDFCFWLCTVEVCVALHWLGCSKWNVEKHDQYYHVSSAIVVIVVIALLNFYLDLYARVGVSVGNRISAEGAKVGDALKDNTTLTSFSLDLGGEQSWFGW